MRGFELTADEPPSVGGTDTGPTPTELFMSSVAVCFAMAVYHAARKRSVELPDLAVTADGTYEGRKFAHIRLEVASSLPRPDLEKLLGPASAYCFVSNTLRDGPELEVAVSDVNHEPPPPRD